MIIKVTSIEITGTTAVITGQEIDAGIILDTTFEYILTLSKQYTELKFDYTGYITVDIDGTATCDLTLTTIFYSIAGVVNIGITPTIQYVYFC